MKKGLLTLAVALAAVFSGSAKTADDPVLLKIDGRETRLSEFEYLYNKNNQQQGVQQSRDEYLDMFLIYKLKVADAITAGIDTTKSFVTEFDKYRKELAAPYLLDKDLQEKILQDAYNRLLEDVNVSHIMVNHDRNPQKDAANKALLDSIRTDILAGKATWDAMVLAHSIDPAVRRNGNGDMGFISGNGTYPQAFEAAAYQTAVGEISPVIDSGFGYHIVRVNSRRPARGQVLVEHILKLTQGMQAEQAEKQKEKMDSIYKVLIDGADFEDVARRESEDPGSARNGGKLDWFGTGRMVKPFEDAAFAAQVGEITKPFPTSYGFHIIKKLDSKGVPSFEESRRLLENQILNDERSMQPREARIAQLRDKYAPVIDQALYNEFLADTDANGGYDSIIIAKYSSDVRPLVKFNTGDFITLGEVIKTMPTVAKISGADVRQAVSANYKKQIDAKVAEIETDHLPAENAEYRNLLNEYHDGILLFEISNRNVWEKASKDKKG
ncbi:MAG: peptidylprolyl isomerase, partial [Muribaculaceae bacterium]